MKTDISSSYFENDSSSSINNMSSGSSVDDSDRYSVTTSESEYNKERMQKSRCRSEKRRRDKLNLFIKDLQLMLPPSANKRLDKSTVLKMTVDYLKLHNDLSVHINGQGKFNKSFFLPCEELGELMLEILNGFLIVINEDAKIVYVADIIEKLLGVKASFYTNKTIHAVIHKDDQDKLAEELMSGTLKQDMVTFSGTSADMDLFSESQFMSCSVSLDLRFLVEKPNISPEYRLLHCTGKWYSFKNQENAFGNKLLVLLACLQDSGIREIAVGSEAASSFTSKHSLDGKFLFADTDCLNVTGHLPYELLGKSMYMFIHDDDLMDLCKVHEKLTKMSSPKKVMTVYMRFCSKAEEWLLFKSDLQLILRPGSHLPDHIAVKFTLATPKETHDFRHFVKKKEFRIEDYLPNIFDEGGGDGNEDSTPLPNCVSMKETEQESFPDEQDEKDNNDTSLVVQEEDDNVDEEDERSNSSIATSPNTISPNPTTAAVSATGLDDIIILDNLEEDLDKEKFFEAQHYLHEQLSLKHERLAQSYKKQKVQLEKIGSIMHEYQIMMQAPSFKAHYEQQQEMYDYFKYMLKKQHRKQEYLFKQLKGRVKELEIKQRAMKLRELASRQQMALTKIKNENRNSRTIDDNSPPLEVNATSEPPTTWYPNESNIFKFSQASSSANVIFSSRHISSIQSTKSTARPTVSTTCNETIAKPPPSSSDVEVNFGSLQDKLKWLQQIQHEAVQIQQSGQSEKPTSSNIAPRVTCAGGEQKGDIYQLNRLSEQLQCQSSRQQTSPYENLVNMQNEPLDCGVNISTDSPQIRFNFEDMVRANLISAANNSSSQLEQASNNSTEIELQSKISKQILVHLQALQKNILQQLQSVLHEKKNTQPDFSQILPVLQQLQHLQQSIIEQQQNQQNQALASPTQTVNTSRSKPMFNNAFLTGNTDLLLMHSLAEQSANVLAENSRPREETVNGSRERAEKELEKIKRDFQYPEEDANKASDCFVNLGSPELSTLMYRNENCSENSNDGQEGNDQDDLKKGEKNLEEENLANFQPLMENQQHLEQLQQYQRMQIFMQQQHQLQNIHTQSNTNDGEQQLNDDQQTEGENTPSNIFTNSPSEFPMTGDMSDISTFIPPENEEVLNMLLNDNGFYW